METRCKNPMEVPCQTGGPAVDDTLGLSLYLEKKCQIH